jgi:hypothetical protein
VEVICAEIVADAMGMTDRLEPSDALDDSRDATAVRDWLLSRTENRLMIVGHLQAHRSSSVRRSSPR